MSDTTPHQSLAGRRALVTGSSKGIGAEIARQLAAHGADVVINYNTDADAAAQVVAAVTDLGRRAWAVAANIGVSQQARELVAKAVGHLGGLDILVNNAGVTPFVPFLELSEETWDRTLNTNLKGMFVCSQAAARVMVSQGGGGRIVNISSGAGLGAFPDAVHYNASKGGVNMLSVGMASALGPMGITVNVVAPGAIALERTLADNPDYDRRWGVLTPLGRGGRPNDVAGVVCWLCGPQANFVTGQVLYVDGGLFSAAPWPRDAQGRYLPG